MEPFIFHPIPSSSSESISKTLPNVSAQSSNSGADNLEPSSSSLGIDSEAPLTSMREGLPERQGRQDYDVPHLTIQSKQLSKEYTGDFKDQEAKPLRDSGYQKLEFESPFDLVSFYNPQIQRGTVTLYPWQLDVGDTLAAAKSDALNPYKFALCACNGSGKDSFVIAPFAVWFSVCKIQSRCIITSASGQQLSSQTESYIKSLCNSINQFHGEEIFRIRQRYILCMLSGSEIRLFATDEEGKAEGYHPIESGTEMAIIINEAKNVAPEIFRALRRCTGYNYWLEVSSPGAPNGDFYDHFTKWSKEGRARHVTTFDCAQHLSEAERLVDLEELGETSALYRSKHLALFTSIDTYSVIPIEVVERAKKFAQQGLITKRFQDWDYRVGIDLAAGGDETCVFILKGNCIVKEMYFREKDTTIGADKINIFLEEFGLPKSHPHIYADDGGIGHGVIDNLSRMHWTVSRVNNQSAASNKKMYSNRGAENWYRVKRILEKNCFFFNPESNDQNKRLFDQLSSRYYKQEGTTGRIALESKSDAKANGRPSPDRADAFILAFTGLTVSDFIGDVIAPSEVTQREAYNSAQLIQYAEDIKYKEYEEKQNAPSVGKFNGSVSVLTSRLIANKQFGQQHRFNSL